MLDASPLPVDPQAPPVQGPPCEAGCGATLTARQQARKARCCSAACRVRAHRAKRKAEVLGHLDALAGEVARIRREVERW